ncbi:hypothetical protein O3M35_011762 [Rhynocoris fuscipes]|uniref:Uncharacterized protein n=1 Tax=Rhynocoris fuscipes TaxID=488301 RepID=A0AAW1CXV3_9HEMI
MARRKAQTHRTRQLKMRLGTPPPVQGRKHEDIQTEEYLEEVFDHPLEMSIQTQTEPHLDRPLTPPFVPQKAGIDAATQIYPGELFQFDVEVKPILEVLVGKTIEQALMEVMEEDELAAIKEQQRRFKEIKDTELAEDARIEESERRKKEEMELRIMEQEAALKDQQDTQERVAAAVLTTGYIADLLPSVFSGLRDEMIRDIVQTRAELYHALGAKDNKRLGLSDEETEEYGEMGGELGEEDYKKGYVMKFGGDDSESTTNV